MASAFLYPRRIAVLRNPGSYAEAPGLQERYQGLRPEDEQPLARDVPASIQHKALARATGAELPADTQNRTNWDILLPRAAVPKGSIATRDIIVDDERNRYQVIAAYWGPLGYRLRCELLEA